MNTQNTTGHNLGLELERTTKSRFLISAGVFYGYKIHDVQIERDFANFDDEAINNLRTPMKIRHIKNRQSYVHTRLMVGYKLPVNNKYSIVAKGGITAHSFTK